MSATEKLPSMISELLTWAEICARHPDEWVCLVEIEHEVPNGVAIRSARVVGHGKTRRAPFDQVGSGWDQYKVIGHYFTGRITTSSLRPQVILDDEARDLFRHRP
jgi:hypothetical protein